MRKLLYVLLFLASPHAFGADKPPGWLTEIATRAVPKYDVKTPAVVLFDEEKVTVDPAGKVTTAVRRAVKILRRDGRGKAKAAVVYRTDSGKVRSLRAWTIYPSGGHKSYGKKDVVEVSLAEGDAYNESRVRAILGSDHADPGSVFGYEAVSEDRSIFTQFSYQFQDSMPALTSRFVLNLPSGWTARSFTYNHPTIEPLLQGFSYSWQLDRLPPIEDEPARPNISSIVPRIAVSYYPNATADSQLGPTFEDWQGVSTWLASLNDPQAADDDAVAAKAGELIDGASSEFERISAIARYVQDIKYVSIQTGVGRGGGYRPHPAAEVFRKSYGDCKDKANLMRAMLRAAGLDSYPVAIYSSDRGYVREEWASPQQFNHAIIAVALSEPAGVPAMLQHESLGTLLLFDPTDPHTPPGHLPEEEQGSLALLVAAEGGGLFKMPAAAPGDNHQVRALEVKLAADGSVEAGMRAECSGDSASFHRSLYETRSRPEYRKLIERWITQGATGATVSKIEAADGPDGQFTLDLAFGAPHYGQAMGRRLLIFKPAIVSHLDSLYFTDDERRYPVVINSRSYKETVRVALPPGFAVDEKPLSFETSTDFGRYSASWEESDGQLLFSRELELEQAIVPAEDYASVLDFFSQIAGTEQTPVVLVRQ